jgi:hypothetical protein
VRDLEANGNVAVHLDGPDVVILEGTAERLAGVDRDLAERLAAESNRKYDYGMSPDMYMSDAGPFAIRPRSALSWIGPMQQMTKFTFG